MPGRGRRCPERKHVIIAALSGGIGKRVRAWAGALFAVRVAECRGRPSEVTKPDKHALNALWSGWRAPEDQGLRTIAGRHLKSPGALGGPQE